MPSSVARKAAQAAVVPAAAAPTPTVGGGDANATAAAPLPVAATATVNAMHGYSRAHHDTASVTDEERVHSLLFQRLQAKKNHNFAQADEVRDILLYQLGVEVFDKTKFWRVAGGGGHVPLPQGESKPRSKPSAPSPWCKPGWSKVGTAPATVAAAAAASPATTAAEATAATAADGNALAAGEALPSRQEKKKARKKEAAAAAVIAEKPIASGFGHAMLLKMGWSGQGSGLRAGAIAEPVQLLPAAGHRVVAKRGLSADDDGGEAAEAPPGQQPAGHKRGEDSAGGEAAAGAKQRKQKKRKAVVAAEAAAAATMAPGEAAAYAAASAEMDDIFAPTEDVANGGGASGDGVTGDSDEGAADGSASGRAPGRAKLNAKRKAQLRRRAARAALDADGGAAAEIGQMA